MRVLASVVVTLLTGACTPDVSPVGGAPPALEGELVPATPSKDGAAAQDERQAEPAPWELTDDLVVFHTPDLERISILDASGEVMLQHPIEGRLGGPPVIRNGRMYLTLRDVRSVAVLEPAWRDSVRTLREVARLEVGPEPRDLYVSDHGGTGWVAVSMEGVVRRIDFDGMRLADTVRVGGQPSWLTWISSSQGMLVAGPVGDHLSLITPEGEVSRVELPSARRRNGDLYARRVTGRPVFDVDDRAIWVPAIYLDTRPTDIVRDFTTLGRTAPPAYYSDVQPNSWNDQMVFPGTTRFMPSIVRLGTPLGGRAELNILAGKRITGTPVRGVFSEIWADPDSDMILAVVQGGHAMLAARPGMAPRARPVGYFRQHYAWSVPAPDGAGELQFSGGRLFAHGAFDGRVAMYGVNPMRTEIVDHRMGQLHGGLLTELPGRPESDSVSEGRSLFYATDNPRMVRTTAGVACATCHAEGGTDNLTWTFPEGRRQTPSLAGTKSAQTPLSWTNDVATVVDDVMDTTSTRMGGVALSHGEAESIAAYIDAVPVPDTRPLDLDERAVARGQMVFESMSCARCHGGPELTDRSGHAMHDQPFVRTPTLLGVRATGPWFHDGREHHLDDVVLDIEHSGVGVLALSDGELDDLVSYLESL